MEVNYETPWRLLVVDDVAVHRSLLYGGLMRINPFLQIDEASSVNEAIVLLKGQNRYHAVICDWMMPERSGLDLLKFMRSRVNLRKVPFLMVSARSNQADIIDAFMAHKVDGYCVKPFTASDVYEKLTAIIERSA